MMWLQITSATGSGSQATITIESIVAITSVIVGVLALLFNARQNRMQMDRNHRAEAYGDFLTAMSERVSAHKEYRRLRNATAPDAELRDAEVTVYDSKDRSWEALGMITLLADGSVVARARSYHQLLDEDNPLRKANGRPVDDRVRAAARRDFVDAARRELGRKALKWPVSPNNQGSNGDPVAIRVRVVTNGKPDLGVAVKLLRKPSDEESATGSHWIPLASSKPDNAGITHLGIPVEAFPIRSAVLQVWGAASATGSFRHELGDLELEATTEILEVGSPSP